MNFKNKTLKNPLFLKLINMWVVIVNAGPGPPFTAQPQLDPGAGMGYENCPGYSKQNSASTWQDCWKNDNKCEGNNYCAYLSCGGGWCVWWDDMCTPTPSSCGGYSVYKNDAYTPPVDCATELVADGVMSNARIFPYAQST